MNQKKNKPRIVLMVLFLLLLWAGMVVTDYTRSTKAQAPVFARQINAFDADVYRGIGYTVIIDDGYAVAPPDAKMKGYFYWGWR